MNARATATESNREDGPGSGPVQPRSGGGQRLLTVGVVGYCLAIVALWAWMRWRGDVGWAATLFLFGPRWICGLPWVPLAVAAAVWQRRLLWPLTGALGLIVVGIMGFQLNLAGGADAPRDLRVMTCNVQQREVRVAALALAIDQWQPDIVALQEVRAGVVFQWPPRWHVLEHDEFIVASRFPLEERSRLARPGRPGETVALRFVVRLPKREIEFVNLHLESPRPGIEAVLDRQTLLDLAGVPEMQAVQAMRSGESQEASRWVGEARAPLIIAGDFNMPADSRLLRRDWSGYGNAFGDRGWGFGFTKVSSKVGWSYGARIDHVLYSPPWSCVAASVADEIGSDHLPLVADFRWE